MTDAICSAIAMVIDILAFCVMFALLDGPLTKDWALGIAIVFAVGGLPWRWPA